MTTIIGRPALEGVNVDLTLRLTSEALTLVDDGAAELSVLHERSPSRAAWLRSFLDSIFPHSSLVEILSADRFYEQYPEERLEVATPHKVTVRIQLQHRMWLRQFECYVQSLDWAREIDRNRATLILLAEHAALFNAKLRWANKDRGVQ